MSIRIEKTIDNKIDVYNILNEKIYRFNILNSGKYLLTRKYNDILSNVIYDNKDNNLKKLNHLKILAIKVFILMKSY